MMLRIRVRPRAIRTYSQPRAIPLIIACNQTSTEFNQAPWRSQGKAGLPSASAVMDRPVLSEPAFPCINACSDACRAESSGSTPRRAL